MPGAPLKILNLLLEVLAPWCEKKNKDKMALRALRFTSVDVAVWIATAVSLGFP
ncbi:MAG: hypothetical protein ACNA8O_07375 [Cyanobacteriota bacterium]|jgi:hypothetical protein